MCEKWKHFVLDVATSKAIQQRSKCKEFLLEAFFVWNSESEFLTKKNHLFLIDSLDYINQSKCKNQRWKKIPEKTSQNELLLGGINAQIENQPETSYALYFSDLLLSHFYSSTWLNRWNHKFGQCTWVLYLYISRPFLRYF